MLTPSEILDAASRKWPNVLRAEVTGENLFPVGVPFGRPRPTADFAVLRHEVEALAAARQHWRIEWEEVETRKWGLQRLPLKIEFDSVEDLAAALGRSHELKLFRDALDEARKRCPALEPWLRAKAHRIVEHLADWRGLIAVCEYFVAHPRPSCYPRQIPISVGTKFIEEHAGILRELLDVVMGDSVDAPATTFAGRFHLLAEPPQVRFRFLDPQLRATTCWPVTDCAIPAPAFTTLTWDIPRVLIVENRSVFLCLPDVPHTLAVFGSGKASSLLSDCNWMKTVEILYWGDCDEAGYGILSSLRSTFSHVRSVLMDEVAWHQWKHLAVQGKRDSSVKHLCLTPSERAVLTAVVAGPWMLEQERIPAAEAEKAILAAFYESSPIAHSAPFKF